MSPAASTRWCPTPEQVMILEEMYRSGVRTPNASHIQQITAHLSHYGKIEGKNVFYWFQNHKARDRQKLRKRLVGKHHQQHQFDAHMMFQIPSVVDYHHTFQQPPYFLHQPQPQHQQQLHHFEQLPCCASSTALAFHPPPPQPRPQPFINSPCFPPQSRSEDIIHAKFGMGNQKPVRIVNNDDWMMRGEYDYNHHRNYNDNCNEDEDEDEDENVNGDYGRKPLKTLELFPIKDKTNLKKDVQIYGHPNIIPFIKL